MSEKNFEKLAKLAKDLPVEHRDNATALVKKMGEVIEGLGDKPLEWRPSTLKLVQATTDRSKLPKGATIGSLVLGEHVVKTPLKVIPLRFYTTRQYWNPDPLAASMVCSSPDGITGYRFGNCKACPHAKFDEVEKRSDCNKTITVISVAEDFTSIFYTNFSKTNYANGVDWQGLMKKAGVSPYKRIYELNSCTSPKVKNVEILKVEPVMVASAPAVLDSKLLPFVEELFTLSGDDRKASLLSFYEYVDNKKATETLLIGEQDGSGNITLLPAAEVAAPEQGGYKL